MSYRAVAPDFIGYGFSAKPRRFGYTVFEHGDQVEALADHLAIEHCHILAHDYGDTVTQELIARCDERAAAGRAGLSIASVTLLNGGLFPETHRPRLIQTVLRSPLGRVVSALMTRRAFHRSFAGVFGPDTVPSTDELDAYWHVVSRAGGARITHRLIRYIDQRRANRERWVGALSTTTVPLRLINGLADPVSGAHMVARYRELVPAADVVELPRIGHYPQVEAPAAVIEPALAHMASVRSMYDNGDCDDQS